MKSLLILTLFAASLAHAAWSDYEEVRDLRLAAGSLSALSVQAGAGSLEIIGVEGAEAIHVTARVIVPDASDDEAQRILERGLELTLTQERSQAVLVSEYDSNNWFSGDSPRIDLKVTVPAGFALFIDDGSGAIEVRDTRGEIVIDDGSGAITIRNVGGPLRIEDGSGGIDVSGVAGDAEVYDGSGSIEVEDVAGSVTLDDGSGSVRVRNVGRDLIILDDGSGSMRYSGIQGQVDDRS